LLFPILALAAAQAAPAAPAPGSKDELRELLQDCSAHSFETVVSAVVEGKLKRSKMKLCGTRGQSDSDWIRTLRDSAAKIAANLEMAPPMREEMVKALNREIALRTAAGSTAASTAAGGGSGGDFTLKPRSATPGPGKDSGTAGYSSLPPLPPPVSVAEATREIASKPYVPPPPVFRPDLRFECFATTGVGEGPCTDFDRYMTIIVTARSAVPPGASLRFVRDGEDQAEIGLGAMRKGQKQRFELPAAVCKGVNGGSLKIETWVVPRAARAQPQLAESEGPYSLRC
jgi:hypothetical protein